MSFTSRIEQIKIFLNDTPDDPFLIYALATEHTAAKNDDEALALYLKLVSKHPNYSATYYHLGKLYERIGEDDKAQETYAKGMEITKANDEKHAYGELRGAFEELTF